MLNCRRKNVKHAPAQSPKEPNMRLAQSTAAGMAAAIACSWCMNGAAQPAAPYPQKPVK